MTYMLAHAYLLSLICFMGGQYLFQEQFNPSSSLWLQLSSASPCYDFDSPPHLRMSPHLHASLGVWHVVQ